MKNLFRNIQGSLFSFVLSGVILTGLLSSMIYAQMQLLQSGREIILKTVPVDPRDLLRGHYTILNYEISRLDRCKVSLPKKIKKLETLYVLLEKTTDQGEQTWKAVSVHKQIPENNAEQVVLQGKAKYTYQHHREERKGYCSKLSVKYGIEKYFAPKQRALALEKMSRGDSTANNVQVVDRKIREKEKIIREKLKVHKTAMHPEVLALRKEVRFLREERRKKIEASRKKISVVVRVNSSGKTAIAGLKIDNEFIYEPFLF